MLGPLLLLIPVPNAIEQSFPYQGKYARGAIKGYKQRPDGKIVAVQQGPLGIRFSPYEHELMDAVAGKLGISKNQLIRQSVLNVCVGVNDGRASERPEVAVHLQGYQRGSLQD